MAPDAVPAAVDEEEAAAQLIRQGLEQLHGRVWNLAEFLEDFEPIESISTFVVVQRKSDHIRGILGYLHDPRYYFDFKEVRP